MPDALSQVLATVRLEAGVFSRAELGAPWAVYSRPLPHALFHVVVRGSGRLERDGAEPIAWRAGDLLVLPQGDAHTMAAGHGPVVQPIGSLPATPGEDGIPCVVADGGGEQTLLLCGTFRLHPAASGFVLGHLPPVLHIRPALDATAAWLDASLRMLTAEQLERAPGSAVLSARLAEMLFVQVLRGFARQDPRGAGWLGGLFDAQLGAALAAVHADPATDWTAATLARQAGMSRSVFFERFRDAVGEAPSAYVTRWRMVVARMALAEGSTLAEAASRTGYGSEASFSRAFKRATGQAPGAYRQEIGAS
jgi:AraC-like DNA-binding protein